MTDKEKCGCHDHECDCGHDHTHEEEADFITLEFDDGEEVECEVIGVFDFEGKDYIALMAEEEDESVLYIYGYKEVGDDEFELVDIEDDDEYEKALAEFDKLVAEEA